MPKTTEAPLIERITAQLPGYRDHMVSEQTLERWMREAAALRTPVPSETLDERAARGGDLPLDLMHERLATEQEAVVINGLRTELTRMRTAQRIYRLATDEHEHAMQMLGDELDALVTRVRDLDAQELPASADEAMQTGAAAVKLWKSLLDAVEAYDEIRTAQEHFTRLRITGDNEHGWRSRFYRVGMFREQMDLDRAWLNRRNAAGAQHFNTSDRATLAFNAWLRPTAEQTRNAWGIVGGDTHWPCTDRVAYLLWLVRHTTPYVPTLATIDAAHKHASWATLDLHPDRVQAAEHHRDAYWRTVKAQPVIPYQRHTTGDGAGTLSISGRPV